MSPLLLLLDFLMAHLHLRHPYFAVISEDFLHQSHETHFLHHHPLKYSTMPRTRFALDTNHPSSLFRMGLC